MPNPKGLKAGVLRPTEVASIANHLQGQGNRATWEKSGGLFRAAGQRGTFSGIFQVPARRHSLHRGPSLLSSHTSAAAPCSVHPRVGELVLLHPAQTRDAPLDCKMYASRQHLSMRQEANRLGRPSLSPLFSMDLCWKMLANVTQQMC